MLPDNAFGAFPGGGVPQRMKANPKNSSTNDMIRLLHASPWCKFETTRAAQVALSTIVMQLTPEQNQALDVFEGCDALLASCAPVIVNERGLLRPPADGHEVECYMLRRNTAGIIHCVYVSEGKSKACPLGQLAPLLDAVYSSGADIARGQLVCLFNNSCLPRGSCSLLFSVLATIPIWSEQKQSMLVKRREFFLQQYITPVRIITNDLVAASNVNLKQSCKRADAPNGLPVYKPKQELPPGSILANILSRRPGLQPPGCVSVPPTTSAACLQAFTACIVEAARLTLGLRTVDGHVSFKQVHARLQQVQEQLCTDSAGPALAAGAHAAAAAGLIDMEATMVPPPQVFPPSQWSVQHSASSVPQSSVTSSVPKHLQLSTQHAAGTNAYSAPAASILAPSSATFDNLASSAVSQWRSPLPAAELSSGGLSGPASALCNLKVRLIWSGAGWQTSPAFSVSMSGASSSSASSSPVAAHCRGKLSPLQQPELCPTWHSHCPSPLQVSTEHSIWGHKRAREVALVGFGQQASPVANPFSQVCGPALEAAGAALAVQVNAQPQSVSQVSRGTFGASPYIGSSFAGAPSTATKLTQPVSHVPKGGTAGLSARDFVRPPISALPAESDPV